jgi:hypothetical protein
MKDYIFLVGIAFLISCSNNQKSTFNNVKVNVLNDVVIETKEEKNDSVFISTISEVDNDLNDIALLVAGIEVDSSSKNYQFTQSSNWRSYSSMLDKTWGKIKANRLVKMKDWQKQELPDSVTKNRVGIYPFSGPDFLTFYTFFGDAPAYYMFGLEPLGKVPNLQLMSIDSLQLYYEGMEDATEDLLNLTFFRTNWMKTELKKNGIIPIILYFLARTDNEINAVNKYKIDSSGNLSTNPVDSVFNVAHIKFLDSKTKEIKEIYYLSADVSNYAMNNNPEILKFLEKIPDGNSYLKAASYLCHHSFMSNIRSLIVRKSKLVLQEDSGIPYKFFLKEKWNIKLFGEYVNPFKIFTDTIYIQENLRNDFDISGMTNPLPFRLGYHSGTRTDNLMLAIQK